jgi:hypothetical protein
MKAPAKFTIDEAQSNDIYKCLVTLQLLDKHLEDLHSKEAIDFKKKQTVFVQIREY